jgi:hypothetical protein
MRSYSLAAVAGATALVALSLVDVAAASCPNACSGHGTCGEFDSCSCYANWQGADCSQRLCPHHHSWITTSKGDLNYDGDTNDATVYDTTTKFGDSGVSYVATQAHSGGDWEGWPSTFNLLSTDEGHFYMECANRGTCDRKSGLCKCFEGYTGNACQRTTCPENCNGRGVCKSVEDQKGAYAYTLWDATMSRSCVCDKGYTGPSCADRQCAVGDDPLTSDQQYETQWIEISAPRLASNDYSFSGTVRLTYTDHNGETYETDEITVAPYEGSTTSTTTAFAAALNNLPNNVLSDVTVSEGWCQQALPGTYLITTNVFNVDTLATYDPTGDVLRCDWVTSGDALTKFLPQALAGAIWDRDDAAITTFTDAVDTVCYKLTNFYCNRYKVTFAATPGDLTALTVDTASVVVNSLTAAQGATGIASSVTDQLQIALDNVAGVQVSFTALAQTASMSTTYVAGTIVAATKVIQLNTGEGAKYEEDERIVVTCNGVAWGTFTVASVVTDAVTVTETIKDCAASVAVTLASYVINTNTKLDGILSVGDRIMVDNFASVPPTIESFKWDTITATGRLILSGAYAGDDANDDETASTKGTHKVYAYGTGTTENSECSDRGVCNSETGVCKCFKGYSGRACSTQNALSS